MIIQLEGASAENVQAARRSLAAMAGIWGYEVAETPADATAVGVAHDDQRKVIDPVSAAALLLSIPSAALAVLDLADRVHKRRRADELIDHAQQLAAQQVTVCVMSHSTTVELSTLGADQLLDLLAGEGPAS